jgi:hypothetical protein
MATTAQRGLLTSLYGFDPVQRRAEQQAGLDRFLAAQQTPQARMGAALGSLFGQYLAPESEEQTRVAKVNSIYNQVMADADPTKPTEYLERLGRLAQSFQQAGLPEQAEITIDRISKLTPKREIKEVGGVLVEIPPGKGTPTTIFTAPKPPEAPLTIADRTRLNELIKEFGDVEGAKKFRAERDEAERKRAAASAPPKAFGADINLRESFLKEVNSIDVPLNALDKAEALLIEQSGLADSIAKRQFAKFAGDRDISNKDVAAFGNFGPLGQRLSGIFSQFLQGTYSDAQREEAIRIIKNLRNPLEQQRATIEQQFTGAAARQGITGDQASFVVPSRAKGVRQITAPSETGISNAITLPSGNKARPIQ